MRSVEDVNYIYVGRNGGCQLIKKIEDDGIKIKAYLENGDFFETSRSNFYQRIYKYDPIYFELNAESKLLIESLGIPIIKNHGTYEIPSVAYESMKNGIFSGRISSWKVKPFYNSGIILFKLFNKKTEFIITSERLKESFRGAWDEFLKNLRPLSKEESEKILKRLGLKK